MSSHPKSAVPRFTQFTQANAVAVEAPPVNAALARLALAVTDLGQSEEELARKLVCVRVEQPPADSQESNRTLTENLSAVEMALEAATTRIGEITERIRLLNRELRIG